MVLCYCAGFDAEWKEVKDPILCGVKDVFYCTQPLSHCGPYCCHKTDGYDFNNHVCTCTFMSVQTASECSKQVDIVVSMAQFFLQYYWFCSVTFYLILYIMHRWCVEHVKSRSLGLSHTSARRCCSVKSGGIKKFIGSASLLVIMYDLIMNKICVYIHKNVHTLGCEYHNTFCIRWLTVRWGQT